MARELAAHGRVDAALGGVGVASDRVDLGDDGDIDAFAVALDAGPHAGEARADDQDIMLRHR